METETKEGGSSAGAASKIPSEIFGGGEKVRETGEELLERVYVKKWVRTKHAILFRLNNKVVQVIFQDQTEIILSSELRVVTYVNKKAERLSFPLSSAMDSPNQELRKRLHYTKDILTRMLSANPNAPTKSEG